MSSNLTKTDSTLVALVVIFAAIAVALACIGVGSSNWQTTSAVNPTNGQRFTDTIANFFYTCRTLLTGEVQCANRLMDNNNIQYYNINAPGDKSTWNLHLNFAASMSIASIVFIFMGAVTTLCVRRRNQAPYILLIGPGFLFVACVLILATLAEGARVLQYNGYSVILYQTTHVLTIFSLLISAILGGRLFDPPCKPPPPPQQPKNLKRMK